MLTELLEYRLNEISCKVDHLGTIAWVAASSDFDTEKCEEILDNVLFGIKDLSDQISADLDKIINEL